MTCAKGGILCCVTVSAGFRRIGTGRASTDPNGVTGLKPRVAPKALPWVGRSSMANPNGVVDGMCLRVDPLRFKRNHAATPLGLP